MAAALDVCASLLILALCFLAAGILARRWAFFADYRREQQRSRYPSLEGLRALLALAVFLHHARICQVYYLTGKWKAPDSAWFNLLGQGGVAMFFMITGFLFWEKLVRGKLDWALLYQHRLFRLVPLYALVVAMTFLIAFGLSGFSPVESAGAYLRELLKWLSFGYVMPPDINGFKDSRLIIAYVNWTLALEWQFYLLLPVLYCLCGPRLKPVLFGIGGLILFVQLFRRVPSRMEEQILAFNLFFAGIVSNEVVRRFPGRHPDHPLASLAILALLGVLGINYHSAYGPVQTVLIGAAFALIARGNTLFGLLGARGVQALGAAGYSIYLLHGMVVFLGWRVAFALDPQAQAHYWGWVSVFGLTVTLASLLAFRWIEYPCMQAGKRRLPLLAAAGRTA